MSAGWGNVAEWFGAVAALVVGLAIYALTRAANATNERVARINEGAIREAARLQDQERTLLLAAISNSVGQSRAFVRGLIREIEAQGAEFPHRLSGDAAYRARLVDRIRSSGIEMRDHVRERLYLVGNPLAVRISRADGFPSSIAQLVAYGSSISLEEAQKISPVILAGLRNMNADLAPIHAASLNSLREGGLILPDEAPAPL